MSSGTETCKKCQLEKDIADFPKGKRVCKSCISQTKLENQAKKGENAKAPSPKEKVSPTKDEPKLSKADKLTNFKKKVAALNEEIQESEEYDMALVLKMIKTLSSF